MLPPDGEVELMTWYAKQCLMRVVGLLVTLSSAARGSERYGELYLDSSASMAGVMGTLTSL